MARLRDDADDRRRGSRSGQEPGSRSRRRTVKASNGLRRVELAIDSLTCSNCAQTVEQALRSVPGVKEVAVNRASGVAFVDHDPSETSVGAMYEAIKVAGYRTGSAKVRFHIKGMTCASCVTAIEGALRATRGVLSAPRLRTSRP
jgi:Cu+-exporting ATPase